MCINRIVGSLAGFILLLGSSVAATGDGAERGPDGSRVDDSGHGTTQMVAASRTLADPKDALDDAQREEPLEPALPPSTEAYSAWGIAAEENP
jgi:hypothetical protein